MLSRFFTFRVKPCEFESFEKVACKYENVRWLFGVEHNPSLTIYGNFHNFSAMFLADTARETV